MGVLELPSHPAQQQPILNHTAKLEAHHKKTVLTLVPDTRKVILLWRLDHFAPQKYWKKRKDKSDETRSERKDAILTAVNQGLPSVENFGFVLERDGDGISFRLYRSHVIFL